MNTFAALLSFVVLINAGQACIAQGSSPASSAEPARTGAAILLPAGTAIELQVTAPVRYKNAKAGDLLYAQTNFPVAANNSIAIPAGTYVEGVIESVTRPSRRRDSRAAIDVLFTKIIFAGGYTVVLPGLAAAGAADATPASTAPPNAAGVQPTSARVTIAVSTANDLLLDNGAQIEMALAAPLALDAGGVAAAVTLARAPEPGKFKSATQCRPTAGTPGTSGTSDTVIPGTPGTPSTTIPGGPGMPDIVIPGTPDTPATVIPGIPGTSGTAGTSCPAPPVVVSSVPIGLKPAESGISPKSIHN